MPTVVNDIFRVAARMHQPSIGDFVNVYHFQCTTVVGSADATARDDMALLMDAMYTLIQSAMPDGMTFEDVNIFNVTQNRPLGSEPWPVLTTGGQAADELAAQTAVFLRGLTGFSRNWARKFIGPFTENSNSPGGIVATPLMNALVNFGGQWLSAGTVGMTNIYNPVVRYAVGGVWAPITSIVISNIWATIRRRRIGRGS